MILKQGDYVNYEVYILRYSPTLQEIGESLTNSITVMQQEPKCLAALCARDGDPQMLNTFLEGKDLYSAIASVSFGYPYEKCLEFFPKGTPIKKDPNNTSKDIHWIECSLEESEKLADGETDTQWDGKERRTQAKSILLGRHKCPVLQ